MREASPFALLQPLTNPLAENSYDQTERERRAPLRCTGFWFRTSPYYLANKNIALRWCDVPYAQYTWDTVLEKPSSDFCNLSFSLRPIFCYVLVDCPLQRPVRILNMEFVYVILRFVKNMLTIFNPIRTVTRYMRLSIEHRILPINIMRNVVPYLVRVVINRYEVSNILKLRSVFTNRLYNLPLPTENFLRHIEEIWRFLLKNFLLIMLKSTKTN